MLKAVFFIITICSVLFFTHPAVVPAQSSANNTLERMKTDVYRFGIGEKARVVVSMKDGTKVKGHIIRTGDDSFELAVAKTGRSASIAYQDVSQIRKPGMSTMAKVAIGVGVGAAIAVAVIAIAVNELVPGRYQHRPSPVARQTKSAKGGTL